MISLSLLISINLQAYNSTSYKLGIYSTCSKWVCNIVVILTVTNKSTCNICIRLGYIDFGVTIYNDTIATISCDTTNCNCVIGWANCIKQLNIISSINWHNVIVNICLVIVRKWNITLFNNSMVLGNDTTSIIKRSYYLFVW